MGNKKDCGRVYVLTNPVMAGLVKIGYTEKDDVKKRVKELSNPSGIPLPFECHYACEIPVAKCRDVEKALHTAFAPYRINEKREFFSIDPSQPTAILKLLDGVDITVRMREEINKGMEEEYKDAEQKIKKKRRPALNFYEMGINEGSHLHFGSPDSDIIVKVVSPRKVLYQKRVMSLSAIERELRNLDYNVRSTGNWFFNGESIGKLYEETYPLFIE